MSRHCFYAVIITIQLTQWYCGGVQLKQRHLMDIFRTGLHLHSLITCGMRIRFTILPLSPGYAGVDEVDIVHYGLLRCLVISRCDIDHILYAGYVFPGQLQIRARYLSLPRSKLRLCLANHRAGYFSNLACDWLSIDWAYSEQETENGLRTVE